MKPLIAMLLMAPLYAQTAEQLEAHGASVANVTYQGKAAVRLDALPNAADGASYAVVNRVAWIAVCRIADEGEVVGD